MAATEKSHKLFINRELSWLEFNLRVLELANDPLVPLGEQCKFAAIYGSNLDEFFMVRVGSLYDQTLLKSEYKENKTNLTATQQLGAIMPKVAQLQGLCDSYVQQLWARLEAQGLQKVDFNQLSKSQESFWKKYFNRELYPVLSPQIIDRRHPFPFLRNNEIYVGALLQDTKTNNTSFGLIPVSSRFERLLYMVEEQTTRYALVEELILKHAQAAFGKIHVVDKTLFRVTRNADLNTQEGLLDQDIDLRVVMSELVKKRRKLAAVRIQFFGEAPPAIQAYLTQKLKLPAQQCFQQAAPLDLSCMHRIAARLERLNRPALFYEPAKPILPTGDYSLREVAKTQDVLLAYPYQSMKPFIAMLRHAAYDPDVVSIKMTLYRVANDSQIIDALTAAAENGKEVVTIVELRARFDEENNIEWSHRLQQAGCSVIYGFNDYKVHSKLMLITRRTGTHYEHIAQIGTGNYNEKTSEQYADLSFVTCKTEICEEVAMVFNNMAMERFTNNTRQLIVAPLHFKSVLLAEIEEEVHRQQAGEPAHIYIKCNSISDKDIIKALSKASQNNVQVDMIVRGICCLQAGLPGISDNITVRSIVGRYLEHARIYAFGEGARFRAYIASGDFLTRNTERRVEVGVRIDDAALQQELLDILNLQLADNANARIMQPDGSYQKVVPAKGEPCVDSQMQMYAYTAKKTQQQVQQQHKSPAQTRPKKVSHKVKRVLRKWLRAVLEDDD